VERRAVNVIRDILQDPLINGKLGHQPRLDSALDIFYDMNRVTLEATERVTKIIKSLKSFARLDQPELDVVDLHEGLESTLTLLDHLMKDRIKMIKNYGDLPKVQCYASRINQVFANVLTNAVQAIQEAGSITITTRQAGAVSSIRPITRTSARCTSCSRSWVGWSVACCRSGCVWN
jgi:signal transduction histidine kinase